MSNYFRLPTVVPLVSQLNLRHVRWKLYFLLMNEWLIFLYIYIQPISMWFGKVMNPVWKFHPLKYQRETGYVHSYEIDCTVTTHCGWWHHKENIGLLHSPSQTVTGYDNYWNTHPKKKLFGSLYDPDVGVLLPSFQLDTFSHWSSSMCYKTTLWLDCCTHLVRNYICFPCSSELPKWEFWENIR